MAGSFNYSDLVNYRNNFNNMYKQYDAWLSSFLLNEGMRFIAEVKVNTPVDTGDLRNHWQLDKLERRGNELLCWFVNPMYYATYVEYGHAKPYKSGAGPGSPDWVEGYFMMTVSLDKINNSMPRRFDKEFKKFLLSLGGL